MYLIIKPQALHFYRNAVKMMSMVLDACYLSQKRSILFLNDSATDVGLSAMGGGGSTNLNDKRLVRKARCQAHHAHV